MCVGVLGCRSSPEGELELGVGEGCKELRVGELLTELAVQAYNLGGQLGRTGFDEAALDSSLSQPHGERVCHELGSIVPSEEIRLASWREQRVQNGMHFGSFDAGRRLQRDVFAGELVHHAQDQL